MPFPFECAWLDVRRKAILDPDGRDASAHFRRRRSRADADDVVAQRGQLMQGVVECLGAESTDVPGDHPAPSELANRTDGCPQENRIGL